MAQVSAELIAIRENLTARDRLDSERRKVDDARDERLLDRVDKHGTRMTTMETRWEAFFGDNGAWNYVKKKIEATDKQNRVIIGFGFTTMVGVILNLWLKH